ncbi:TPA: hypothetical protein ACV5PF_000625 [Bacillus cereus]
MKYTYEFYQGPFNLLMIKLPENISLVGEFLENDIQNSDGVFWLSRINKVLNCEVDSLELGGNSCDLEIRNDFTKIIHRYIEDENYSCNIETDELQELILVWVKEKEKEKEKEKQKNKFEYFWADIQKYKTFIVNNYDEDEISLEIETITLRNLIHI